MIASGFRRWQRVQAKKNCQAIASSLDAVFDSVALFVEFTLGVLFVAHVPASQFEYGVRTSHYSTDGLAWRVKEFS